MRNILTVDVEDWYHICDIEHILPSSSWDRCESRIMVNVERILTLLSRFKVKATFFVLGYIAERTPEVVKMIYGEGHEIASHGYGHVQVYKLKKDEFLQDLIRSKTLIKGIIGERGGRVIGYRAPQWSICGALDRVEPAEAHFVAKAGKGKRDSYWALDLLAQNGFLYDSSIAPLRFIGVPNAPTTPYTLSTPHGEIKEFPPLVMRSPLGNLPIGGGSSAWDRCESRIMVNVERILTLLSRFKVKATFFVLGYIAERTPEVVKMIYGEGHEIASHGYGHVQVYKLKKDEFLQDLIRSKTLIEGIIGERGGRVIGYRAPQWSICKGEEKTLIGHSIS